MSERDVKKFARLSLASAMACCFVSTARAEEAIGDKAGAGHVLALEVCAACHVVAKDQGFTPILRPPAPSFSAIARRSALSEAFLRRFLSAPHGTMGQKAGMPNPRLAEYQVDEIVAYFLSLEGAR